MELDLEWKKGPPDFSKLAICNLKGNNFNQDIYSPMQKKIVNTCSHSNITV